MGPTMDITRTRTWIAPTLTIHSRSPLERHRHQQPPTEGEHGRAHNARIEHELQLAVMRLPRPADRLDQRLACTLEAVADEHPVSGEPQRRRPDLLPAVHGLELARGVLAVDCLNACQVFCGQHVCHHLRFRARRRPPQPMRRPPRRGRAPVSHRRTSRKARHPIPISAEDAVRSPANTLTTKSRSCGIHRRRPPSSHPSRNISAQVSPMPFG